MSRRRRIAVQVVNEALDYAGLCARLQARLASIERDYVLVGACSLRAALPTRGVQKTTTLTDKKAQNRNELSYLINLFKLLIHRLQIL
jgi:hypothetical protein